jgi:hypothetical protein
VQFERYTPLSRPSIWPRAEKIKTLGVLHVVVKNGDFAKKLASELDLILNARDVAEGLPLEHIRWVQPSFILVL